MKICNHNIQLSEIIGIGPLVIKKNINSAFQEVRYSFQVHCRQQSIEIESDAETFFGNEKHVNESKARMEDFKSGYQTALSVILQKIDN